MSKFEVKIEGSKHNAWKLQNYREKQIKISNGKRLNSRCRKGNKVGEGAC